MQSILIAEDDAQMRGLLVKSLKNAGLGATGTPDGAELLALHRERPADLLVLDLMMPRMSGFQVLKALRPADDVPVIILTGEGQVPSRLEGFSLGADDYLTKPFSVQELLARIRAILRRRGPGGIVLGLESGPFLLDSRSRELLRDGRGVALSPAEFRLMEALLRAGGTFLSREDLVQRVWPPDSRPSPRTVDVHMVGLRRKLNGPGDAPWILTEPNRGYAWTQPVRPRGPKSGPGQGEREGGA